MGNYGVKLPQPDPHTPYFLIILQPPNRIKLALADDDIIKIIRQACQETWPQGVQTESRTNSGCSHKLKFAGTPFSPNLNPTSTNGKLLMVRILSHLYEAGWMLILTSELCKESESCTFFFQKRFQSLTLEKDVYWMWRQPIFCLSTRSIDIIQLINATENVVDLVSGLVTEIYKAGIERRIDRSANVHELKLRGKPWSNICNGTGEPDICIEAIKLLLALIQRLASDGYKWYGSANIGDSAGKCIYFVEDVKEMDEEKVDRNNDEMEKREEELGMVYLYGEDGLLLVGANNEIFSATKMAILDTWPGGIIFDRVERGGVAKFRIKGQPWRSSGPDVVATHRFISNLVRALLACGWNVEHAFQMGASVNATRSPAFLLRPSPRQSLPQACINLNNIDKLRVIGDCSWVTRHQSTTSLARIPLDPFRPAITPPASARPKETKPHRHHSSAPSRRLKKSTPSKKDDEPQSTSPRPPPPRLLVTPPSDENLRKSSAPPIPQPYHTLIQLVHGAIEKYWPYGIDRERDYYGSRELRLQGCPWSTLSVGGGNRLLMAAIMMCHILKSTNDAGWRIFASVTVASSKPHQPDGTRTGAGTKTRNASKTGTQTASWLEANSWFMVYDGPCDQE